LLDLISILSIFKTSINTPIKKGAKPMSKTPSRRGFLMFLGLGGVGLAGAILWDKLKPSPARAASFQAVSIDRSGKATTSTGQADYIEHTTNGITIQMMVIPQGTFTMGSPTSEPKRSDDEAQNENVNLKSFLMSSYPVTNDQWRQVMKTDPSAKSDAKFRGDKQPVIRINWQEAREFCQRISKEGRQYRLPTEAEWEYACRAGTTSPFAFGETITPEYVNYNGNEPYYESQGKSEYRQRTVDVDYFKVANGYGLYQMHGNVWEWCLDEYHVKYDQSRKNGNEAWGRSECQ